MDFLGERLDAFAQRLGDFGQLGVLADQFEEMGRLFRRQFLPLFAGLREVFAVLRIGIGMGLVAIRLARLGEQNQRCRVGCLQAERQIQKYERIDIEMNHARRVQRDPCGDDHRLADKERRRSEKPRERLGLEREPIVPENRSEMKMWCVKTEMVFFRGAWGFVFHGLQ